MLTESEMRLAEVYASQLRQLKIDGHYIKAHEIGDTETVADLLGIASDVWADKVRKIQTVVLTNPRAKGVLIDVIKKIESEES